MKKLLVIAAVASLATSVQAATTKSTSKPSAKSTSVESSASAASSNGANSSSNGTSATSTSGLKSPVSAAVGNSTITTNAENEAKAGQLWSASFVSQAMFDASELNYANANGHTGKFINFAGLGYKINAANSVGLRQYFTVNHKYDSKTDSSSTATTANDTVLTYTRKMGKFLGSDPVAPMFWYYAPTSEASQALSSNGKLRIDAEFDWTLTPKWSVGYYFNPRQTMIQDQYTDVEGKKTLTFSRSVLIHEALLYYNVSDATQGYIYGGYNHSWRTSQLTLVDESAIGGLGVNLTFFKGKLILNPEVSTELVSVKDSVNVADNKGINESNLTYSLIAAITF